MNYIDKFVSSIITNPKYNLDQDVLAFDYDDQINYLYGQPIRIKGKTYQTNQLITEGLWETLNDLKDEGGSNENLKEDFIKKLSNEINFLSNDPSLAGSLGYFGFLG